MIRAEGLQKRFGGFEAVRGIDLDIPPGELFCFLGPNGAGKTTTIKMLCGLLRPTQGRITIGEYDLLKNPLAVRRIAGYIPDTPFLYERLTATEFMYFTGDLYGIKRPEVRENIDHYFGLLGLEEHRHTLNKELSHGLRQRLVYSATFMHRPQVLFVDEPFVGLDPYTIRLVKNMLREQVAEGVSIFLTTHILALAEDLADRIGIISEGRLAALGAPNELSEHHASTGSLEEIFLDITGAVPA